MQETHYNGELVQKIFRGKTREEVEALMNGALRPGEEVIRRVELEAATVSSLNRHERRKAAALARRSK